MPILHCEFVSNSNKALDIITQEFRHFALVNKVEFKGPIAFKNKRVIYLINPNNWVMNIITNITVPKKTLNKISCNFSMT